MMKTPPVFALEIAYYETAGGKEVPTPALSVFVSASVAAKTRQGIDITEGDLYFFDASGLPLQADFSEKPYVDAAKNKYFAGIYSLRPGTGAKLQDTINKIIAGNAVPDTALIVYRPDDDEDAQWYGWANRKAMEEGVNQALKIFPADLIKRVKFE